LQPALFIDRDGTISEEIGYVNHASRYQVYPYSAGAIRRLNEAGWLAILVTNQAGVARGYFTEDLVRQVHDVLTEELTRGGARLDAIYYCPHHPAAGEPPYRQDCACRKPRPGLIQRATREFSIDLSRSWMVGDRRSDIELARNAGLKSAFVLSGYGRGEWEYQRHKWTAQPDLVAEDLAEVVEKTLNAER
jgi:D-glycero-D-manno-heptose 1,7-bisphosphate phosphatase